MKKKEQIQKAEKRKEIELDLTISNARSAVSEKAVYLLTETISEDPPVLFLTPDKPAFDSVMQLLNDSSFSEVVEERETKSVCCNLRCIKEVTDN